MLRASVLIPTHEHAATLPLAVASVQNQRIDEIEILIVGDGVDDELRRLVAALAARDSRIRFFDLPKGARNGEVNRDIALREARGHIVCYQSDDDLWLPGHLTEMETALQDADFALGMHVNVDPEGRLRGYMFDIEKKVFKEPWLAWVDNAFGPWASNGAGLSFAAHRLEAYRRLPVGWSVTPTGLTTDQFMWHKFASQPWCRLKYLPFPISLHFPASDRSTWPAPDRARELEQWSEIIASPDGMRRIVGGIMSDLCTRLLEQRDDVVRAREAAENGMARAADRVDALSKESELLAQRLATVSSERDALLESASWRVTAPLRAITQALRRITGRRGA